MGPGRPDGHMDTFLGHLLSASRPPWPLKLLLRARGTGTLPPARLLSATAWQGDRESLGMPGSPPWLSGHDAQSFCPLACPGLMASSVRPQGKPPSEGRLVPGPKTLGCHLGIWGSSTGARQPQTRARCRPGAEDNLDSWLGTASSCPHPKPPPDLLATRRGHQSPRSRGWSQRQWGEG